MGKIEKEVWVCSLHPQRKKMFWSENLDEIFIWVDASYSVHHDMNIQTRGLMSMGLDVPHCIPSKKNLNKKSSKAAELVSASDYVPYNIWYIMFMNIRGN